MTTKFQNLCSFLLYAIHFFFFKHDLLVKKHFQTFNYLHITINLTESFQNIYIDFTI